MSERPRTSIERLRDSVAVRVRATSLRSVARQVGMSPSGLDKFLTGSRPYAKSRRKLFDWWQRQRGVFPSDLSAAGMGTALSAMVGDLPPERREAALRDMVEMLFGLYQSHTEACPAWLAELAEKCGPGSEWLAALELLDAEEPPTT